MFYGVGGSNLDNLQKLTIDQMESYNRINGIDKSKVNITAQFTFSAYNGDTPLPWQNEDSEYKGTMRWYMTDEGWEKRNNFDTVQMAHNPDVLTDFINWSTNKFPAEKYILVLKDHGVQFSAFDQPVDSVVTKENARAILFDANNGNEDRPLSIFGLEEAIKNSGKKMEAIFLDACLLGQVEQLYQIKDQTNYVLSSSAPIWVNNSYGEFIDCFVKNESAVDALIEYLKFIEEYWGYGVDNKQQTFGVDLTLTDMSKMKKFADSFKKVKESLIKEKFSEPLTEKDKQINFLQFRPSLKQIERVTTGLGINVSDDWKHGDFYYYDFVIDRTSQTLNTSDYTSVDLESAFILLSLNCPDLDRYVNNMRKVLDEVIIFGAAHDQPDFMQKPSLGIMFIDKQRFEKDFYTSNGMGSEKYPSIKSCYKELAWDKDTGWSEFFERNVLPDTIPTKWPE